MPYFCSGEAPSSRLSVTTATSCHGRLQLLRVRRRSESDLEDDEDEEVLERLREGMSIGSEVAFLLMLVDGIDGGCEVD